MPVSDGSLELCPFPADQGPPGCVEHLETWALDFLWGMVELPVGDGGAGRGGLQKYGRCIQCKRVEIC